MSKTLFYTCICGKTAYSYFLNIRYGDIFYIRGRSKGIPGVRPPPEVFGETDEFQENFQEENMVDQIEKLYEKANEATDGFTWRSYAPEVDELDRLIENIPQEVWLQ